MAALTVADLVIAGAAAIATILATYFAWRAARESRATVDVARDTLEVGRAALTTERQNLVTLEEAAHVNRESLELAKAISRLPITNMRSSNAPTSPTDSGSAPRESLRCTSR